MTYLEFSKWVDKRIKRGESLVDICDSFKGIYPQLLDHYLKAAKTHPNKTVPSKLYKQLIK